MQTLSQEINMQELCCGAREAGLGGRRVELGHGEDRAPEPSWSRRAGVGGQRLGARLPVFLDQPVGDSCAGERMGPWPWVCLQRAFSPPHSQSLKTAGALPALSALSGPGFIIQGPCFPQRGLHTPASQTPCQSPGITTSDGGDSDALERLRESEATRGSGLSEVLSRLEEGSR